LQLVKSNAELLALIRERVENWNVESTLGDIFADNIDLLRPHLEYIGNYTNAADVLEELIATNSKSREDSLSKIFDYVRLLPSIHGHSLNDFLILPVQRIPRYRVLLQDLLKNTSPDSPDHAFLTTALRSVSELAENINENNRKLAGIKEWQNALPYWQNALPYLNGISSMPLNLNRGLLEAVSATWVYTPKNKISKKETTSQETVFLMTDLVAFGKEKSPKSSKLGKMMVTGGKKSEKTRGKVKITEIILLTPEVKERAKSMESFDFPGAGTQEWVLDLEGKKIHLGSGEKLEYWIQLVKK